MPASVRVEFEAGNREPNGNGRTCPVTSSESPLRIGISASAIFRSFTVSMIAGVEPLQRGSGDHVPSHRPEAGRRRERLPVVGLYVDLENHGAIKLYQRHNFEMAPELTSKDDNGIVHVAMLRRLS